uniref:ZAD domain-containing protein n=1 Tax=Stomoxys calcitrans TaxID=35570 RepID=A0A1I8Q5Z0_STOCA
MDISKQSPAFIRNLCRTCMSASANIDVARNTTIFKQYLHEKPTAGKVTPLTLHQLLQSIRPDIYTHKEDKLPQVMCLRCIDQLQAVHEYIKMCQNSEREFRKLLLEPDERTPPRVEETITDSSPTVANEEYQTITVKDENMDVYESYEINIGNNQDQETTQSTSNTDMLPHTSSADMMGFHSSYGRSDESQDDDEWTPLAKRMHLFTSEIAAIKSELNVIKPKQEEISKLMAENILLLRRNLGVFELTKTVFPIQSVDQLEKIESDLKTDKQLDIIGTIKDILCGSLKNLGKILDKRIIMTYNYDGMKGKKSLKSYESLMNAVFAGQLRGTAF